MKLLLHSCCAPCLGAPWERLRSEGYDVTAFFYNPNIHPLLEFRKRLKAVRTLSDRQAIPILCDETYGLHLFLEQVWPRVGPRCEVCFRMRLQRTAEVARARGDDAFSTTLLSSPHQDHEQLRRLGEASGQALGVTFFYRDLRPLHQTSLAQATAAGLYRQSYCGCIFSEEARYRNTRREIYRGPSEHVIPYVPTPEAPA